MILAYTVAQSLDITGPLEVFDGAQKLVEATAREDPGYKVTVVSRDGETLETSSGLKLVPDASLEDAPTPVDTLLVAGGNGWPQASADPEIIDWIARVAPRARRTASVCTGAFLLAQAGLLDGLEATTHWAAADELARRHPAVTVNAEPIFIRDGTTWTSAGVTAGMDLALALVEDDLDRETALTIARYLVLFLRRPGGQSQFSATLAAQEPQRESLRALQRLIVERPAERLTVEAMAERVAMSPRHFARAFRAETGLTPARYVERVRVEAARRALEDTSQPVALITSSCGFGTTESMRRAFLRTLGVAPAEYRRRFHSTIASAKVA